MLCQRPVDVETAGHLFGEKRVSPFLKKKKNLKTAHRKGSHKPLEGNINIILSGIISGSFALQLQVYFGYVK